MLWFRVGEQLCSTFTLLFTIGILYAILDMITKGKKTKAMEEDPAYNGTLTMYIVIIIFQFWINFTCLFGFVVSFKVWRNNYQMDKKLRHWFRMWLSSWFLAVLGNLGVAIYAMIKGNDVQDEMSYLYAIFSRYAADTIFVASFEKYQRESSCCGIYGPDDWFMLQLRSSAVSGGGGGGHQSLESGFKTNPSTGHCHLRPPTIPSGCGNKILEEVYLKLRIIAGLAILESVIGTCAGVLAWVCFFYWLEKEVIILPDDEISNLIVVEPETSTSTVMDSHSKSKTGLLPSRNSVSTQYSDHHHKPGNRVQNSSRIPRESFYSSGVGPSGSGPMNNNHHRTGGSRPHKHSAPPREPQRSPSRFREYSTARLSHGSGQVARQHNTGHIASHAPPTMKTSLKFNYRNKSKAKENLKSSEPHSSTISTLFKSTIKRDSSTRFHAPNDSHTTTKPFWGKSTGGRAPRISSVGHHDANSRYNDRPTSMRIPEYASYIPPYHHQGPLPPFVGSARPGTTVPHFNHNPMHHINPYEPHKKHSQNHQLHKQEEALGGKLLGEMHIDHSKDPDPMNPTDQVAKGEIGHQDHHATVAIVKNKNAPKPKKLSFK